MDLREIGWRVWSWLNWLRIATGGGSCEYGDEPSRSSATELYIFQSLSRRWSIIDTITAVSPVQT
jgi:hypothetical protein